jgi:flagellum-specific peptidoglycan hydrolase FlgJ
MNTFSLLLNPPYLYVFVNLIIIFILASSKLHNSHRHHSSAAVKSTTAGGDVYSDVNSVVYGYGGDEDHETMENFGDVAGLVPFDDDQKEVMVMDGGDDEVLKGVVRIDSMETRVMDEKLEALKRKVKREKNRPLSPTKFHHRNKPSYDGVNAKSLRVLSKPKRDDTLENTWKTITDGRSIPLTRHLKNVDTWDAAHVHASKDQITPQVKKSETLQTSSRSGLRREPLVKLKKDPSLSQDELNMRVEAFIDKFNEEMRLQRKQSLINQEMLEHGVIIQ